ncbi:MAG: GC-type dockerin domain-anchored protein [Phycisphaerales bacterium JB059]
MKASRKRGRVFTPALIAGLGVSVGWVGIAGFALAEPRGGSLPVPTTLNDFFMPGSQPGDVTVSFQSSATCMGCHSDFSPDSEPWLWAGSMMAQSARDPLYHAALAIANQDADFAGDLCIRCHAPLGWLEGHSVPTDGSALVGQDLEGVACHFCHRMVDPFDPDGVAPAEDAGVLAMLSDLPVNPHSGQYVVDYDDRRRGPFETPLASHAWLQSPFHQSSSMCATCHDVSNPAFERQPDGTYALGALDTPAADHDKYQQFPVERTYSEWLMSEFATGPIDMGGRFGGDNPLVSTCQDCHMPDTNGPGCFFTDDRPDMPRHYFNGGNTWVLKAVRNLYPDMETFLSEDVVNDSISRAVGMLQAASDLELSVDGSDLVVRIINQSGHKLPTGYPEGRRMWINVRFFDASDTMIAERGAYDDVTAVLNTADTKVYEGKLGLDAAVSAATGVPEGASFHFVLNNVWLKDNRIPPRGFTNAGFDLVQAAPVGATYADGQYWDDTHYAIPAGATRAEVSVWYQTASKEYIEFLRDENTTDSTGQIAYDQWELLGKSPPVEMDFGAIDLPCNIADLAPPAGVLDFSDVTAFLVAFSSMDAAADLASPEGVFDFSDVVAFLAAFGAGCP